MAAQSLARRALARVSPRSQSSSAVYLSGAPPATAQTQTAVEYYYAAWNYYFVTSSPDEIAGLDGGAYGGAWQRTGETFNVWTQPVGGSASAPVAFSAPVLPQRAALLHAAPAECAVVKNNPDWLL